MRVRIPCVPLRWVRGVTGAHSALNRRSEGSNPSGPTLTFRDRLAVGHWALAPATQVRTLHPEPQKRTASKFVEALARGLSARRGSRLPFIGHPFVENLAPSGGDLG